MVLYILLGILILQNFLNLFVLNLIYKKLYYRDFDTKIAEAEAVGAPLSDKNKEFWKKFFSKPAKPAVSTIQGVDWERDEENKKRLARQRESRILPEE